MLHTLEPERRTLHGHFSRELPPALTISPGDTVRFRTLDAGWGLEPLLEPGGTRRKFEPRSAGLDDGHAMCGPIAIKGAEPGMVLQIDINTIRPGTWGTTYLGGEDSPLTRRFGMAGQKHSLRWTLDPDAMVGQNQFSHRVALRPFMGVMGMPPDQPGVHSTVPPRPWGGNMDCRELVAGSTLFLPIPVPGALFSVGDGHAAQGDGEVCQTAIECPMDQVDLTFSLRDDLHLSTPRALTPAGWLTMGFEQDLDEAMVVAVDALLDLMGEQYGLGRADALAMASVVADLRITQIVNEVRGVHALLPHGAIRV